MAGMASQMRPEAESYSGPLALSLLLHLIVFGLAFWGWSATPRLPDRPKVPTQVVQARILQMKPKAPVVAPKAEPVVEEPRPVEKPVPDPRIEEAKRKAKADEARKQAEAEKRRKAQIRKQKAEAERKKAEQRKRAEEKRKQAETRKAKEEAARKEQEALRQRVRDKLERLAAQQKAAQVQASQDTELVQSFQSAIRERVARFWSRPPSARNGMTVDLLIQLVPDGSVIEVVVLNSSGNAAFDRSAVLAVQKAGKLPVPDDPRLFDKEFRRFKMRFRPEDLNW